MFAQTPVGRKPVALEVRPRTRRHDRGRAERSTRGALGVVVFTQSGDAPEDVSVTLLHELVHLSGCWEHDQRFRQRLLRAAAEAWPDVDLARARVAARDSHKALDAALVAALSAPWWQRAYSPIRSWLMFWIT